MTLGGLVSEALYACELLKNYGLDIDLYNLRFIKPIDEEYLLSIMSEYSHVFLVEDGSVRGGSGEYIASLLVKNKSDLIFQHTGIPEKFLSQALRSELLADCGLDSFGIAASVTEFAGKEFQTNIKSLKEQFI